MKAAVLIDGGFYIKKVVSLWRKNSENAGAGTYPDPSEIADRIHKTALENIKEANKHLEESNKKELYRILFYDCPPFDGGHLNPITNEFVHFDRTDTAKFRNKLHEQLKKKRKVALRLGHYSGKPNWVISPSKTKDILKQPETVPNISGQDISLDLRQKGVDMKIGLDIAALAMKKMVDQIILISGDSDFVPAAKFARREGIDFVLDAMGNHLNDNLHEHIDGLLNSLSRESSR